VGNHAAIVPSIRGRAWITSFSQYVLAPDDPFPEGFTVGDVWPS
jgi:proline racemase